MCGIFGFTGPEDPKTLKGMGDLLAHRGPDDFGWWSCPEVSLGMRRLSIIDLAGGKQPVANEDESIRVVFNGEIYNHVELRAELEAQGHRFRTSHSDTETLVHLYEQHGPDFANRLNGMFAFAIWDSRRQELHLYRDHSGIKPLYFSLSGGRLCFGSEPKVLLSAPWIKREPDYRALHHYFTYKHVPAPGSAFAGIEQLRPGERAVFSRGRVERHRWWRLRFREDASITEAEAAKEIRRLLEDSVRLQMRSDVTVGAYLSGGLDSSSVLAVAAGLARASGSSAGIKTFTLTYDQSFGNKNEDRRWAREVSKRYGTEHFEHVMTTQEAVEAMDEILGAFDEPFSGAVSTFFLTRLISKHVKVALSGDGADELFGSYLPHRLAFPLEARLRGATGAELGEWEGNPDYLDSLLKRGDETDRRMGQYVADEAAKHALYTEKMKTFVRGEDTSLLIRKTLESSGTKDALNRILHLDFETLLPDQVLAFVDRLSMAHSVEVRPPFLDFRIMEYAARLPGKFKIKNGRCKHVLKEAVKDLLPEGVIDRPKEGFVLPIHIWMLGALKPYAEKLLSKQELSRHGLLDPDKVRDMVETHFAGRADHGSRLWNLMMFQAWWNRFFS